VIFAFHNNRWLIHTLVHGRANEGRFHVHGYIDQGTTTTPFDMTVRNELDRFHLAAAAIDRLPQLPNAAYLKQEIRDKLIEHKTYIAAHGIDMPSIRNWQWPQ